MSRAEVFHGNIVASHSSSLWTLLNKLTAAYCWIVLPVYKCATQQKSHLYSIAGKHIKKI